MTIKGATQWIIGVSAALLLSMAVAGFSVYWILLIPPVQDIALKILQKKISSTATSSIAIGSISTNLFSHVDLYDIKIVNHLQNDESIIIDHIHAGFILPAMLAHRIVFTDIIIDAVAASISIDADGSLAIPLFNKNQKLKLLDNNSFRRIKWSGWDFSAHNVLIKKISGEFNDIKMKQHAMVGRASVKGQIFNKNKFRAKLNMRSVSYSSLWWNGEVRNLFTDISLNRNGLNITQLQIQAEKTKFVGNAAIPFKKNGLWDLEASVSTHIDAVPILFDVLPGASRNGFVSANASLKGTLDNPLIKLKLHAHNLEMNDVKTDSLSLVAEYKDDKLLDGNFTVESQLGDISGSIKCEIPFLFSHPEINKYNTDISFQNFKIEHVKQLNPKIQALLSGINTTGFLSIQGSGSTTFPSRIKINGLARSIPPFDDSIQYEFSIVDTNWKIAARLNENVLHADGQIVDLNDIEGIFSMSVESPSNLLKYINDSSLDGHLEMNGHLGGTIYSPTVKMNINGNNLLWNDVKVDKIAAIIHSDNKQLQLDSLYCSTRYDLALLPAASKHHVNGNIAVVISGYGNIGNPSLQAIITGKTIILNKIPIDTISGEAFLTGNDSVYLTRIKASSCSLHANISGNGVYSIHTQSGEVALQVVDRSSDVSVSDINEGLVCLHGGMLKDSIGANFEIENISLGLLAPWISGKKIGGLLNASGAICGKPGNPFFTAILRVKKPVYNCFSADYCLMQTTLLDSTLKLSSETSISPNDNPLFATAIIPFLPSSGWLIDTSGKYPLNISVDAKKIPIREFFKTVDTTWNINGITTLSIGASLENKQVALNGMLDISNASIVSRRNKIKIANGEVNALFSGTIAQPQVSFRMDGGPIDLSGGRIRSVTTLGKLTKKMVDVYSVRIALPDSGLIHLDGKMPLKKSDPSGLLEDMSLNFSIVYFPLNILASFLPENLIQDGIVQGNGKIRFIDGKPALFGKINLKDGSVVTENLNPSIGPVNATFYISGDSIVIKEMNAQWGKGKISAEGSLMFRDDLLPSVFLNVEARNLSWHTPDILYGAVDYANLRCTTSAEKYIISGNIKSGSTRYIQDLQLAEIIGKLQSGNKTRSVSKANELTEKMVLDIAVDLQENVDIDINLGNLKIDGDCILSGTVAKPSYVGEISLVEGYVLYLDRQFVIDHATLVNYNALELLPVIELEAEADIISITGDQIDNYNIVLTLEGDLRNPVFSLKDKTGTLNELEIISILTLGQPPGSMGGDIKERLRTFVSQSLLGFGSRKLEEFLGIEKIDLKGNILGGNRAAENTRLTIAKRVTPKLVVLYESEIGNLNRPKISALYRIASNFFLSGERNEEGEAGVDVIFKYSK